MCMKIFKTYFLNKKYSHFTFNSFYYVISVEIPKPNSIACQMNCLRMKNPLVISAMEVSVTFQTYTDIGHVEMIPCHFCIGDNFLM